MPWQLAVGGQPGLLRCSCCKPLARRFQRALGNNDIAFWLISQRILPPVAVVMPIYVLFQQLHLLDTQLALIITYVATNLPIVVWLMRDYFQTIPIELEECAAIDGASSYRIFCSIVLPLAVPGLVATFLFVLVFAWNEYLLALFLSSANAQTMPLSRRPERHPRPAMVVHVGADPDHDRCRSSPWRLPWNAISRAACWSARSRGRRRVSDCSKYG